ncbi:MAG: SRPBCC family protein [Chloroflexota bacterium]
MIRVKDSIKISRPPSQVFAFIADLNNIPKWQAEVVKSTVATPGPTKVGTRFTEGVKMGPIHTTADCEVTEFIPDNLMAFKAKSSLISYEGRILVEPFEKGTNLTMQGTAQPKGWWRLMELMLAGEFRSGVKKELAAVKEIVEK